MFYLKGSEQGSDVFSTKSEDSIMKVNELGVHIISRHSVSAPKCFTYQAGLVATEESAGRRSASASAREAQVITHPGVINLCLKGLRKR